MGEKNALVALANYYQFSKNERIHQPCVNSRMLLWCKSGLGRITVNRETFEAAPGKVFWLPWGKTLTYQADAQKPFWVGGVHIVPDHSLKVMPQFNVAHQHRDPLSVSPGRRDTRLEGLEGILQGNFTPETPLARLSEFVVESFRQAIPSEKAARLMARLLILEARLFFNRRTQETQARQSVPELGRLFQFIEDHLHEPLSLCHLVRFSGKSAPTLCRLFKRYCGQSPVNVILDMKMEKARCLLLSGNLSAAAVGQAVGIEDPYYFSKLFKKRMGRGPRDYRKAVSLV